MERGMGILTYLMRPKGRNAASPQAGTEIKKWEARSTPLHLISASLCAFADFLQADFSSPQSTS